VQHLAFLLVLVNFDLSKSLQRPGKLYCLTVYCAMIWVFKISLSLSCWCFIVEPMLWPPASHNLRLLGSYPWPQASSGGNMSLMHPHA
jgi:hypothetical protein